jgi:hypothetical protein
MKRMLGLAATLACLSWIGAADAAAQCGEQCTPIVNDALEVIGYGCAFAPDFQTTCTATAFRCTSNSCGAVGLIVDMKGTALASAQMCDGKVRGLARIRVVPATAAAAVTSSSNDAPMPTTASTN